MSSELNFNYFLYQVQTNFTEFRKTINSKKN